MTRLNALVGQLARQHPPALYVLPSSEPRRREPAIPAPQPIPAAKKASFAATDTSGQNTKENMTAKAKNMIATAIGLRG